MQFLYGLDALLGIVVSLATLGGLAAMYLRGGQSQSSTSVAASPSAERVSAKKRGFPIFKLLLIGALGFGALFFFRGGMSGRDGAWDRGASGGGSRFERVKRWRDRNERPPRRQR